MKDSADATTELAPINPIRVETALSRYPVHRLARKGNIKIEVSEGNGRGGASTEWKVSYNSEYGQPGPLAYKLDTLIINRRIEEARRPVPRILKLGSLSDLCRELGLADSGKNRSDLKRSLFQNAFAGITAKTRYRQEDGSERSLEAAFTRYSVILTGEKLPDGRKADGVYVVLNDVFIGVINGAMTRPLDYEYLKSLPPAPQRFYELLSYQMYFSLKYDKPRAKITYSDLCAHAPQTRHVDWEKVRSQMAKVHKPHRDSGYIAAINFEVTADAEGRPDWIMFYQPGPKARAEFRAFTKRGGPSVLEIAPVDASPLPDAPSELERQLIERGVTAQTAAELDQAFAEERITAQIERFDWRMAKKSDRIEDPAAYLVSGIRGDYAAPKGFVSKAEQQRRLETKAAKERNNAEEARRKREQDAAERKEREDIEAYWNSLTAEQQVELQGQVDAQADPEQLAMETGPLKSMGRRLRRNDYIRQLLRGRQTP
jgi:hypothetical protein